MHNPVTYTVVHAWDPTLFHTDFKAWALSDIFDKTQTGNSGSLPWTKAHRAADIMGLALNGTQ